MQVAKWISALLLAGSGLCAAVIVLRILKQNTFRFGQLELPLKYFPWALGAMTAGHAYLTWLMQVKVGALLSVGVVAARDAWAQLGKSDALVFNGMSPRVAYDTKSLLGTVYTASNWDPPFWLTLAFAVSVVAAVIACRLPKDFSIRDSNFQMHTLNSLAMGTLFALLNWIIGSSWAIQLSQLAK